MSHLLDAGPLQCCVIALVLIYNVSGEARCSGGKLWRCFGSTDDVINDLGIPNSLLLIVTHIQIESVHLSNLTNEMLLQFPNLLQFTITADDNLVSEYFHENVFENISITELVLTNNRLEFNEHLAIVLDKLKLMKKLNINGNPMSTFHPKAIFTFDRLTSLTFNPSNIICNCQMSWFRNYLINRPASFDVISSIECSPNIDITDSTFCSRETNADQLTCNACTGMNNVDCNRNSGNESCRTNELNPMCMNTITLRDGQLEITKKCAPTAGACTNRVKNNNAVNCYGGSPVECVFCCRGKFCNHPETAILDNYYPLLYPWIPVPVTTLPPTTLPSTTLPPTTLPPTTRPPTTLPQTTLPPTTLSPTTLPPSTLLPTTLAPTTLPPTTLAPTTLPPTTLTPTKLPTTTLPPTSLPPTTLPPTTLSPIALSLTTLLPTTLSPTTLPHTTLLPTPLPHTTLPPTTLPPTTLPPTTMPATTLSQTPLSHTTLPPTSLPPTTLPPTTLPPTTLPSTTLPPTPLSPTTLPPTTLPSTALPPTTLPPTTLPQTTLPPTTLPATILPPTTLPPTTLPPTTLPPTTLSQTTLPPTTLPPTTLPPTTLPSTTLPPTTLPPTTLSPKLPPKTLPPTILPSTTFPPTTLPPTTLPPTTLPPTTLPPTTLPPTALPPTTLPPTILPPTILPPTTPSPSTLPPTSLAPTTTPPITIATTTLSKITLSPTSSLNISSLTTALLTTSLSTTPSNITYVISQDMTQSPSTTTLATTPLMYTSLQSTSQSTSTSTSIDTGKYFCEQESEFGKYRNITWPKTKAGNIVTIKCQYILEGMGQQYATRNCLFRNRKATWMTSDTSKCPTYSQILEIIANQNITEENIVDVSSSVAKITENSELLQETDDVEHVVEVIETIADVLTQSVNESEAVLDNVVEIVNHLANFTMKQLLENQRTSNTSSRILKVIDTILAEVEIHNSSYAEDSDTLSVKIIILDNITMQQNITFPGALKDVDGNQNKLKKRLIDEGSFQASIMISSSILRNATRIQFALYKDPIMFTVITASKKNLTEQSPINCSKCLLEMGILRSAVISASIGDQKIINLEQPVVSSFIHSIDVKKEFANNSQCVFWDFNAADGNGEWSRNGCKVYKTADGRTTCHCDHLTNFAMLLDIYNNTQEIPNNHKKILTIISLAGSGISFIALIVSLASYSCAGRLLKEKRIKVLLNLMVSLLLMNTAFLFDSFVSEFGYANKTLCFAVAVSLHYTLLTVMCWMAIEAFTMYLALVKIFDTRQSHFIPKVILLGWVLPAAIVGCSIAIDQDGYGYYNNLCYLGRIPFLISFALPAFIVLTWNTVVFALVSKQMCGLRGRQTKMTETFTLFDQLKASFSLTCVLGLTWMFAFLSFSELNLVFTYMFVACNALQGLIIFVFHCVLKQEIRRQWHALCCPCISMLKYDDTPSYTRSRTGTNTSSSTVRRVNMPLINMNDGLDTVVATNGTSKSNSWFWNRRRSDVLSTATDTSRLSTVSANSAFSTVQNRTYRSRPTLPSTITEIGRSDDNYQ